MSGPREKTGCAPIIGICCGMTAAKTWLSSGERSRALVATTITTRCSSNPLVPPICSHCQIMGGRAGPGRCVPCAGAALWHAVMGQFPGGPQVAPDADLGAPPQRAAAHRRPPPRDCAAGPVSLRPWHGAAQQRLAAAASAARHGARELPLTPCQKFVGFAPHRPVSRCRPERTGVAC